MDNKPVSARNQWAHSPLHLTLRPGTYMVTAATCNKAALFHDATRLNLLAEHLLLLAQTQGCELQAWAIFPNHYHYVARLSANSLSSFSRHLHAKTAVALNKMDAVTGRKVWFQYWDSHLTFERSYLARLSYVHHNAVHHGIVKHPSRYPWCSAGWLETKTKRPVSAMITSFHFDKLNVPDDFDVHLDSGVLECGSQLPL
jgi:putative transposase